MRDVAHLPKQIQTAWEKFSQVKINKVILKRKSRLQALFGYSQKKR